METNNKMELRPKTMMIELTNNCNLRCSFCYNKNMKREKGFMSVLMFKILVDDFVLFDGEELALYTTGESFLHPDIYHLIRYAKDAGVKYVYVTTNGLLVDIPKLINSGIDSIKFSLDASVDIGQYDIVKKKIIELHNLKKKHNIKINVVASVLIFDNNNVDYYKGIEKYVDKLTIEKAGNQGGKINFDRKEKIKSTPCSLLWDKVIINWNADVTACCIDFDGDMVYGNVYEDLYINIFNNKKINKWRKLHKEGKLQSFKLCKNCDYIYK